jgi:hypothetical protein
MTVEELETKQSDSNTEPFSRCKITSESCHEKNTSIGAVLTLTCRWQPSVEVLYSGYKID